MADQETTVPMDDKDLMASALAAEPTQETPASESPPAAAEPKVDETGRLHGEGGRFVSKQAKEAEAAPTQQQEPAQAETTQASTPTDDDKAAQVPSWRLREVREAREAAERRAQEAESRANATLYQIQQLQRQLGDLQKPKAEPVDFFADPEGALQQRVAPIQSGFEQQLNDMRLDMSREMAVIKHGEEAVKEMEAAVGQAMQQNHPEMAALAAQMRSSKSPVMVAMQWHQRDKLQREVGGDLNAYKTRLREELLSDQEFLKAAVAKATGQAYQAAAQPGTRPLINMPPSLNRQTGTAHDQAADDAGDLSDASLYRYATAKGGR